MHHVSIFYVNPGGPFAPSVSSYTRHKTEPLRRSDKFFHREDGITFTEKNQAVVNMEGYKNTKYT